MPAHRLLRRLLVAAAFACAAPLPALAQDTIFITSFETEPFAPASDAEAARFLTQATFGPTQSDISAVRSNGYESWFDGQFAQSPTLVRPLLEQYADTLTSGGLGTGDRLDRWFRTAVTGNDQLRQRMSFALSQILVVSDRADSLSGEVLMMAEYQDILTRRAFGNYRDLLRDVTLSPMMGRYLTHLRNRKKENQYEPDENYAREIMQLFSIGLIERHRDFTPVLVSGNPVPTYDQYTITNMARVFTGLAHTCNNQVLLLGRPYTRDCDTSVSGTQACTVPNCNFDGGLFSNTPPSLTNGVGNTGSGLVHPDRYNAMIVFPRYHDTGLAPNSTTPYPARPGTPVEPDEPYNTKRIVGGLLLQPFDMANAGQQTCHGTATPPTSDATVRQACVDYTNNEVESAISALFLHDNTPPFISRQLIQRFVTSNPTPQYIDRVAAVFEDNGSGVRGDLRATLKAVLMDPEARTVPADPNYGKVREPLLRVTNVWRSFGYVSHDGRRWSLTSPENSYQQRPLGAPTVFNFYEPDYQQPGPIADLNLFSPELQIVNETTLITTANDLWTRITNRYDLSSATNPAPFTAPGSNDTQVYIPTAVLDALPSDDGQIVDRLNLLLTYGSMSGSYVPGSCNGGTGLKGVIHSMIRCQLGTSDKRRKVLTAMHLVVLSPEYSVQR